MIISKNKFKEKTKYLFALSFAFFQMTTFFKF